MNRHRDADSDHSDQIELLYDDGVEDRIRVALSATVENYNAMGREVTDQEVEAVEDASANWAPPKGLGRRPRGAATCSPNA